ncbi:hypothetical protein [Nocardioides mesophilus]|uniref:hypothetical protein n=1 Tax=Nocardioides mesophilus TaxID=433659 RepID=UPI001FE6C0DD|nr:hypothetical protein [Nocardioides mesophilus]
MMEDSPGTRVVTIWPSEVMKPTFTSAAPTIQDGTLFWVSWLSALDWAAALARVRSDRSRVSWSWCRTVKYAAAATSATDRPTAMVASRVTRLASERR